MFFIEPPRLSDVSRFDFNVHVCFYANRFGRVTKKEAGILQGKPTPVIELVCYGRLASWRYSASISSSISSTVFSFLVNGVPELFDVAKVLVCLPCDLVL